MRVHCVAVDDSILPTTDDPGPLAEDDEFTGDETTRDIFPERTPPPAEETAIHIESDEESDLDS